MKCLWYVYKSDYIENLWHFVTDRGAMWLLVPRTTPSFFLAHLLNTFLRKSHTIFFLGRTEKSTKNAVIFLFSGAHLLDTFLRKSHTIFFLGRTETSQKNAPFFSCCPFQSNSRRNDNSKTRLKNVLFVSPSTHATIWNVVVVHPVRLEKAIIGSWVFFLIVKISDVRAQKFRRGREVTFQILSTSVKIISVRVCELFPGLLFCLGSVGTSNCL